MRVFVFEYFTALGIGQEPNSPDHGIYREGRAMRDAVAEDFAQMPGVEVVTAPENSSNDLGAVFTGVRYADWTLVIAPESADTLANLAEEIDHRSGGRHLGSEIAAIRLTADKLALAEHWREHGVPTPATSDREPTACEAFPVVWKPRDGAGSTATFRLNSAFEVASAKAQLAAEKHTGPMILQEYVHGRAASVAFLCGGIAGNVPLLPTFQLLSDNGRFQYLGGEMPIPPELALRATKLARHAVDCVPGLLGYVGVDLVLGDAANGSRDYAIEINPRLTTSYIGLRVLAEFNLAEAMLQAAIGELPFMLRWKPGRVRFTAGAISML